MLVSFTLTPADLMVWRKYTSPKWYYKISSIFARIGAGALGGALVSIILILHEATYDVGFWLNATLGVLCSVVVYRLSVERLWWRNAMKAWNNLSKLTLRFSVDGDQAVLGDPQCSFRVNLSTLKIINSTSHLVILYDAYRGGPSPLVVIPKRAFPSENEAHMAAEFLEASIAKARSTDPRNL